MSGAAYCFTAELKGNMRFVVLVTFITLIVFTGSVGCLCSFPADLRGEYVSSKYGLLIFNDTHVSGFKPIGVNCTNECSKKFSPYVFQCFENDGNKYLLRSPQFGTGATSGGLTHAYVCWYLTSITGTKWTYYQAPKAVHSYYTDYVGVPPTQPTANSFCDLGDPPPARRIELLLKTGSPHSVSCPPELMASFTLTMTSCSTRYDVCSSRTRQTVVVDNPSCLPVTSLPNHNTVDCVYSLSESDVMYMMAYASTSAGFFFTCSAFLTWDSQVYMTHKAGVCDGLEVPTKLSFHGLLSPDRFCPLTDDEKEDKTSNSHIIIIVVILCAALVIAAIVVTICLLRHRAKKEKNKVSDTRVDATSGTSDGCGDVNGALAVRE